MVLLTTVFDNKFNEYCFARKAVFTTVQYHYIFVSLFTIHLAAIIIRPYATILKSGMILIG